MIRFYLTVLFIDWVDLVRGDLTSELAAVTAL
jgi:hypothetical protein